MLRPTTTSATLAFAVPSFAQPANPTKAGVSLESCGNPVPQWTTIRPIVGRGAGTCGKHSTGALPCTVSVPQTMCSIFWRAPFSGPHRSSIFGRAAFSEQYFCSIFGAEQLFFSCLRHFFPQKYRLHHSGAPPPARKSRPHHSGRRPRAFRGPARRGETSSLHKQGLFPKAWCGHGPGESRPRSALCAPKSDIQVHDALRTGAASEYHVQKWAPRSVPTEPIGDNEPSNATRSALSLLWLFTTDASQARCVHATWPQDRMPDVSLRLIHHKPRSK